MPAQHITNGSIVTMDPERRVLQPGHVRLIDGRIDAVGPGPGAPRADDEVIDVGGDLVLPGFVNTHHHLSSTLMRGCEPVLALGVGTTRDDVRIRAILAEGEEEVLAGVRLAYLSLIRSGVTTTTDSQGAWRGTRRADGALRGAAESGLRVVFSPAFTDRTEIIPASHRHDARSAVGELTRLREAHESDRVEVVPEALSLPRASDELIRGLRDAHEGRFAMHLTYSAEFDRWARRTLGRPAVLHLQRLGVLDERFLGAHPVHLDDDELAAYARSGAGAAYCAVSNMAIGAAHLPLGRLTAAGVPVGLGLDHPNDGHDLFETMKMTLFAQRQLEGEGSAWPAERALELATLGGAAALHLEDEIGSLEPGKAADVMVVDHRHPDLQPAGGSLRLLVMAAGSQAVRHVIADGRWLLRDGQPAGLDEDAVLLEATQAQSRVLAAAGLGSRGVPLWSESD